MALVEARDLYTYHVYPLNAVGQILQPSESGEVRRATQPDEEMGVKMLQLRADYADVFARSKDYSLVQGGWKT